MATKKNGADQKRSPKPGKQRYRRSDDELIADLKARINELEQRKATKQLKASPASRQASSAYRALTKGIEMCEGAGDAELKRTLSEAQRLLATHFESQGVKLPKARKPRARQSNS